MFHPEQRPRFFIVSGPAGSGKTTLCDRLLAEYPRSFCRVVTSTTRAPREVEKHGRDYYFLSSAEFQAREAAGEFYETAEIHGRHYGTLKSEVREKLAGDRHILMNIDVQGAASYRRVADGDEWIAKRLFTIFIQPPDLEELRVRLQERGDSKAEIARRLETARGEMQEAPHYDRVLVSADKGSDFSRICEIIREAEREAG
jgi:guanylate kinase